MSDALIIEIIETITMLALAGLAWLCGFAVGREHERRTEKP